ncbi:hypothetical protein HMPREF1548_00769 [Clostridium sp. KLE 1755]|jgi:hypothetical protein|nr:hypothetical protein HMPREF1548_00769 [Clostridium sp. KLE 1755]
MWTNRNLWRRIIELKKAEEEILKVFINTIKDYTASISYIESVIIVSSYARGTNKKGQI